MDTTFEYKGYVGEVYHFTYNGKITGYGAKLYKDGKRLVVTNHGWNLIQGVTVESVIEKSKKYIDELLNHSS